MHLHVIFEARATDLAEMVAIGKYQTDLHFAYSWIRISPHLFTFVLRLRRLWPSQELKLWSQRCIKGISNSLIKSDRLAIS